MNDLATPRLRLRPYRAEDRGDFVGVFTDTRMMTHVGGALSRTEAERLFAAIYEGTHARARAAWTVEQATTGAHVGHAALLSAEQAVEVGFILRPEHWGCGLATELARALVAEARARFPRTRIIATVDLDHAASRRVLEKAGLFLAGERTDDEGVCLVYELPDRSAACGGDLPDARDGLRRLERVILVELARLEGERSGPVPTAMLYGRVVEHVDVGVDEFQAILARLVGRGAPGR